MTSDPKTPAPLTCGDLTPCHDCDRDGDAECGLEYGHEGDHVPAADVERMRLEDALDATRAQLADATESARNAQASYEAWLKRAVEAEKKLAAATERAKDFETKWYASNRQLREAWDERDAAQRSAARYKRVLEACDEAAQRIRLRVDSRPADTVSEAEFHELLDEQARGIQARIRAALSSSSEPRKGGET